MTLLRGKDKVTLKGNLSRGCYMGILKGQVALITGGSSGIGEGIAHAFAREGSDLALIARNPIRLERTASKLREQGVKVLTFSTDVRDERRIQEAVRETISVLGGIDILVNSAGTGRYAPVAEMDLEEWEEVIETNLTGTFICCKAVMPHMMERKRGRIINISSVAGKIGFATGSAYCASKWGVIGFSRSLAVEAKPYNIRVDVICPGTVDTPFPHSPAASKLMLEVEDVVKAVMFLLSLPERARVEDIVMHPNV
ncbi:TPA: SDR family oxidoreductase [Candidatus Poribacteria bacterium]|nr:SDR family oxidoreductase [Candidatus Poribacteria bacterium]